MKSSETENKKNTRRSTRRYLNKKVKRDEEPELKTTKERPKRNAASKKEPEFTSESEPNSSPSASNFADNSKDVPEKIVNIVNDNTFHNVFICEIEWKKRKDGTKLKNSLVGLLEAREMYPDLLLDFFIESIKKPK